MNPEDFETLGSAREALATRRASQMIARLETGGGLEVKRILALGEKFLVILRIEEDAPAVPFSVCLVGDDLDDARVFLKCGDLASAEDEFYRVDGNLRSRLILDKQAADAAAACAARKGTEGTQGTEATKGGA